MSAASSISSGPAGTVGAATQLWLVDLDRSGGALRALDAALGLVGRAERDAAALLSDPAVGAERLAAHAALRLLLRASFGTERAIAPFTRTASGRPSLAGAGGNFSLSHVDGWALIGIVRDGQVGVDLERAARPLPKLEGRWVAIAAAGSALGDATARDPADLLRAWVRLEAVAKARGTGIGRLLSELALRGAAPDIATARRLAGDLVAAGGASGLGLRDLALPAGLVGAVAFVAPAAATAAWSPLPDDEAGLRDLLAAAAGADRC